MTQEQREQRERQRHERRVQNARILLAAEDPWMHVEHIHPNDVIYQLHRAVGHISGSFTLEDLRLALPGPIVRCVNLSYVTVQQRPHVDVCGMSLLELHTQNRARYPMHVLSVYAINDNGAVQRANDAARAESQYDGVIMTEDIVVNIDYERTDVHGNRFDENWHSRHRRKSNVTFGIARLKGLTCSACLALTRDNWPQRDFQFASDNRVINI